MTRIAEILQVEDNEAEAFFISEAFKGGRVNKNITVVTDGEAALEFLRERGADRTAPLPDLILLDLNLPKKSGHEVLAAIKSDPDLKHIPVIILTVSSFYEDMVRSYENHANCFLQKPENFDHLLQISKSIENLWLGPLLRSAS